jgi:hypothetical protein
MSLGYAHGFENSVSGSVLQQSFMNTRLDSRYDAIVIGLSFKFGAKPCREAGDCVSLSPATEPGPSVDRRSEALPAIQ